MAQVEDRLTESDELTSREIRDSIRQTRARMDATVGAIEEKLTPGELVHEAWSLFRGGSSSSMSRLWRIANEHPLPSAIISLGLGWMLYETVSGDDEQERIVRTPRSRYTAPDVYVPEGNEPTTFDAARERVGAAARRAGETAGAAVEQAGEMAGQARAMASDAADRARDMASDVASSVEHRASELGRQASEVGAQTRESVRRARAGLWETFEQDPLIVGAATLAAGVLVGLLLPSTRREDELMGEARDSLIDRVKGVGADVIEKSKQVASAAAETLQHGTEAQGLSADAVAEKVRAVGRDVMGTVKTEAEKQNLVPGTEPRREATEQTPQPQKPQAA